MVTNFLRAAVPFSKLKFFRDSLEEGAYRLSDRRRNMSDLISFVHMQECSTIEGEIEGKHMPSSLMAL